jgi:endoglucanase
MQHRLWAWLVVLSALQGFAMGFAAYADEPTDVQSKQFESSAVTRFPQRLRVQGNQIVNASGNVIRFKGIMIPDPSKVERDGKFNRTLFENIRGLGVNVIRIPVHPQHWKSRPDYLGHYLDPAVRWAGELGMYVIVDWHSIGNVKTGYAPQVPELFCHTEQLTVQFWRGISSHFKTTPHVLFEVFNEPQHISAAEWREAANGLIAIIRKEEARQLVLVGGLEYGRELGWVLQEPMKDTNVGYVSHIFPSHEQAHWNEWFGEVALKHPVVITEWGFIDGGNSTRPEDDYLIGSVASYGRPLLADLDKRGIGWVACWYDDQWQPAMFEKGTRRLTKHGAFVLEALNSSQ